MRRSRLCRLLLVLALLMGGGVHLAVIQSYAWAAMAVSNLRAAGSVTQALEKTFDGRHPCRVCLRVEGESRSRKTLDAQRSDAKLDLAFVRHAFRAPAATGAWASMPSALSSPSFRPPFDPPPPRALAA